VRELEKSVSCYDKKTTILVARESTSYDIMRKWFTNSEVLLTPDIVFSLYISREQKIRDSIGICLREDYEAALSQRDREQIIKVCEEKDRVFKINTCADHRISRTERKKYVWELIDEIASRKLLVTDRLHGLILATITDTPCLVFCNNNHKILATMNWLKSCSHVKMIDNIDDLSNLLENLNNQTSAYSRNYFEDYYRTIADIIRKI
jgi:pyruvyl transferase EpsI